MGSADIIPGVSGGTIALVVGIYERLITSVRAAAAAPVALVRGSSQLFRERLGEVEWRLVLPLGLGILTALKIAAQFLPPLLESYPVQSRALFFGLIAGSLLIPWQRIARPAGWHFGVLVAAAIVAFVLVGLPPREVVEPSLPIVFVAAGIAICAMILPGVSGAFLLLVMGMYESTLRALHALEWAYVIVFAAGAATGLGLFSRLLEYLLQRHHDVTMAALVGLMAGSLRALWPYLSADRVLLAPPADRTVLPVIGLALLGFLVVTLLARMGTAAEARR